MEGMGPADHLTEDGNLCWLNQTSLDYNEFDVLLYHFNTRKKRRSVPFQWVGKKHDAPPSTRALATRPPPRGRASIFRHQRRPRAFATLVVPLLNELTLIYKTHVDSKFYPVPTNPVF